MNSNDYQIGGNHYQAEYQCWDFIIDTGMHYLHGCAIKYVYRWRAKNGTQDLKKALHYLAKAEDHNIEFPKGRKVLECIVRFCKPINKIDSDIITAISLNQIDVAREKIQDIFRVKGEL